jgi:DNA-directed RNA polymerase subunit RPC12/RpoP
MPVEGRPYAVYTRKYKSSGYDASDDTINCQNCGGQTMYGNPTGFSRTRKDGAPCEHEYTGVKRGRCYTVYTCVHCGYSYDIDSGD